MAIKPSGISGEYFIGFDLFRRQLRVSEDKIADEQGGYPIACEIKGNQIWVDMKLANFKDDYVILLNGELRFGRGHYYLSEYANNILSAGRVHVFDGKIAYLDNQSGHYQPDKSDLADATNFFIHNKLTIENLVVHHVIF